MTSSSDIAAASAVLLLVLYAVACAM